MMYISRGSIACAHATACRWIVTRHQRISPNVTSRWMSSWESVTEVLRRQRDQGELRGDPAQDRAARRLTRLQQALQGYSNAAFPPKPLKAHNETDSVNEKSTSDDETTSNEMDREAQSCDDKEEQSVPIQLSPIPRGVFLYGDVGTGKSMLMDLFYQHAPVEKKRRVHFHSFLQNVHQRIHDLKRHDLETRGRERNPIVRVAHQLASEVMLLCFDEFQVTDVADALILKQLFEVLFARGTVMVATSNRPPSDLYEGGINRSYFLPFLDLLHQYCVVHELKSNVDYRTLLSEDLEDFFLTDSDGFDLSQRALDKIFDKLLQGKQPISLEILSSFNRKLRKKQAHPERLVARFQFDELCNAELGSSDYRAIAEHFEIVMLERIPHLTLKEHDQARRFITLVDELYEGNCVLACSAIAYPQELFVGNTQEVVSNASIEAKVGEMFGIDVSQSSGKNTGELASVRELSFAFRRAASRLTQMCSRQCWDQVLNERPISVGD